MAGRNIIPQTAFKVRSKPISEIAVQNLFINRSGSSVKAKTIEIVPSLFLIFLLRQLSERRKLLFEPDQLLLVIVSAVLQDDKKEFIG